MRATIRGLFGDQPVEAIARSPRQFGLDRMRPAIGCGVNTAGNRHAAQQIDIAWPIWVSEGLYLLHQRQNRAHWFGSVKQIHRPHFVARGKCGRRRIRHPCQPARLANKFNTETKQTEDLHRR